MPYCTVLRSTAVTRRLGQSDKVWINAVNTYNFERTVHARVNGVLVYKYWNQVHAYNTKLAPAMVTVPFSTIPKRMLVTKTINHVFIFCLILWSPAIGAELIHKISRTMNLKKNLQRLGTMLWNTAFWTGQNYVDKKAIILTTLLCSNRQKCYLDNIIRLKQCCIYHDQLGTRAIVHRMIVLSTDKIVVFNTIIVHRSLQQTKSSCSNITTLNKLWLHLSSCAYHLSS